MREFKLSQKSSDRIMSMYMRNEGFELSDIFKTYSIEKARAYKWCYEQFSKDEFASNFHIARCGTFGFIACWNSWHDEKGRYVRVETSKNSYIVWLDE